MQAELLKELRGMGDEESEIKNVRKDALMISIGGIAQVCQHEFTLVYI